MCQISTTNICNTKCTFCFRDKMKRDLGTMDWKTFTNIVDNNKASIYNLCGFGEPLCDNLLMDRIKYIKKKYLNSKVVFNSNCGLLTKELVDELIQAGLSKLFVSCYGLHEQHDRLQPCIKFDHVVEIVRYAECKIPIQIVCNEVEPMDKNAIFEFWKLPVSFDDTIEWGDETVGKLSQISGCGVMSGKRIFYWTGKMATCCFDYNGINEFDKWEDLATKQFKFCEGCKFKQKFDDWRVNI